MAIRLQREYNSTNGTLFRIEIHQNNYVGEIIQFDSSNCIITSEGGVSMFQRMIATTVSFDMDIDSAELIAFVESINTANETDLYLKLYRENNLIFKGYLIYPAFNIPDKLINYKISIVAACGIGRLRNKSLDFSAKYGAPLPSLVSLFDVILLALEQAKVLDLYENDEPFLYMRMIHRDINFVGFEHPLREYKVNPYAFANEDRIFENGFTAIQYIMESFNCRLHYRDGAFVMENIWLMRYESGAYWEIDKLQNYTFDQKSNDVIIDFDNNQAYQMPNNMASLLPAPRVINLSFSGGGINNLTKDVVFTQNNFNQNFIQNYVFLADKITSLAINFLRETSVPLNFDYPIVIGNWVKYELEIKIGNRWLVGVQVSTGFDWRHLDPSLYLITPIWSLSQGYLTLYSDNRYNLYDIFYFDSLPLVEADGYIEIKLISARFIEFISFADISAFNFESINVTFLTNSKAEKSNALYYQIVEVENSETLPLKMALGDVADLYDSDQRLFVGPIEAPVKTGQWNGTDKDLQNIVLSEVHNLRATTLRIYNGSFINLDKNNSKFHNTARIIHRNRGYLFLNVSYSTEIDEISGQWVQIRDASFQGAPQPPVPNYPVLIPDELILIDAIRKKVPREIFSSLGGNFIKENLEFPEITKLAANISEGDILTSLDIAPLTSGVYAGDRILLLNLQTNAKEITTVFSDGKIGDTIISIVENTFLYAWESGAIVTIEPKYISENALTINSLVEEYFENVQDDFVHVTVGTLPDITIFSVNEIRRRVKVYVGSRYRYNPVLTDRNDFKIDNNTNNIIFNKNLRGAMVDIELLKARNQ